MRVEKEQRKNELTCVCWPITCKAEQLDATSLKSALAYINLG